MTNGEYNQEILRLAKVYRIAVFDAREAREAQLQGDTVNRHSLIEKRILRKQELLDFIVDAKCP